MGIRSEVCAHFNISNENIEVFKDGLKAYIINNIDDSHMNYLISNFYQVEETNPTSVGFCFFNEFIKFDYIQNSLNSFFDFLESFEFPIKFEAKELCSEFVQFGDDYSRSSDEDGDTQLYINCTLEGMPETNDITLLNWLNNQNEKSSKSSILLSNSRSEENTSKS